MSKINWKEIRSIVKKSNKSYEQYCKDVSYLKEYDNSCTEWMESEAKRWGQFAPWDIISRQLKRTDIDFMREYADYIRWDLVSDDILNDEEISKEFELEIESWKEDE